MLVGGKEETADAVAVVFKWVSSEPAADDVAVFLGCLTTGVRRLLSSDTLVEFRALESDVSLSLASRTCWACSIFLTLKDACLMLPMNLLQKTSVWSMFVNVNQVAMHIKNACLNHKLTLG